MALSKQSAGNGSASGSAPHHVPASTPASLEADVGTPAELVDVGYRALVDGQTMLLTIGVLAEQLLDLANDDTVQCMAEAIKACASKGDGALIEGQAPLLCLAGRLQKQQGGAQ